MGWSVVGVVDLAGEASRVFVFGGLDLVGGRVDGCSLQKGFLKFLASSNFKLVD